MGKLITSTWITLDGFICGPNGEMDFVGKFFDEEMGKYEKTLVDGASTLLLGKTTYDSFAGSWPNVPDNPNVSEDEKDYARVLNKLNKVVYSKSLKNAEWNNSILYADINKDEIIKLKSSSEKNIVIYGSASIIQQLTALGLIDEYQLLVHPIFLGSGKPLFKDKVTLSLLKTDKFISGVMFNSYNLAINKQ